jgi:hypothetical protein
LRRWVFLSRLPWPRRRPDCPDRKACIRSLWPPEPTTLTARFSPKFQLLSTEESLRWMG